MTWESQPSPTADTMLGQLAYPTSLGASTTAVNSFAPLSNVVVMAIEHPAVREFQVRNARESSQQVLDRLMLDVDIARAGHVGEEPGAPAAQNRPAPGDMAWRHRMDAAIRDAAWIAELGNDWDGEASPAVLASTWARAVYTLRNLADRAAAKRLYLPPVQIAPNGHGSIDLFWTLDNRALLINVPADLAEPPSYSTTLQGASQSSAYLDTPAVADMLVVFLND